MAEKKIKFIFLRLYSEVHAYTNNPRTYTQFALKAFPVKGFRLYTHSLQVYSFKKIISDLFHFCVINF